MNKNEIIDLISLYLLNQKFQYIYKYNDYYCNILKEYITLSENYYNLKYNKIKINFYFDKDNFEIRIHNRFTDEKLIFYKNYSERFGSNFYLVYSKPGIYKKINYMKPIFCKINKTKDDIEISYKMNFIKKIITNIYFIKTLYIDYTHKIQYISLNCGNRFCLIYKKNKIFYKNYKKKKRYDFIFLIYNYRFAIIL